MKILVATIPLRGEPSASLPLGSLGVMHYVRKHCPDATVEFLNIDAHRWKFPEVLERIREFAPDILGISAVVSTAYAYTKRLSLETRKLLPQTHIVVGGNLCASAEVLLRCAEVDLCVLGEGERVFLNVVNYYREQKAPEGLRKIRGLAFLDPAGKLVNTGYEVPLPAAEIWDVDLTDLERDGTVDIYFPRVPLEERKGKSIRKDDNRFDAIVGTDKRFAGLTCAKGCVSRCTFCHRWDKGIRHIPLDTVFKRLDHLIERYNVGVVSALAESFGTDRKWLDEFIRRIEPYNILWRAGGVRTSTVDPDLIARMKRVGCYSIIYGNETGSAKMLDVMEKKVALEDNYNAAKWTIEAGLGNIIQLVIGMPGECPETIRETIDYCKYAACLSPLQDPRQISINFAQALPGTPLYEFARKQELVGNSIEDEEAYLISISDKDAADPLTCINFTNYPRITLLSWNLLIRIEVRYHYFQKYGAEHYYQLLLEDATSTTVLPAVASATLRKSGSATPMLFLRLAMKGRMSALLACFPGFFYTFRSFAGLLTLANMVREYGARAARTLVADYLGYVFRKARKPWKFQYRSLRKIVDHELPPMAGDTPEMMPLRKGR